jgi:hypothetical protein
MRSHALAFAVLALGGGGAALACPPQPRTAAAALATEREWVAALEQRDSATLDCILAPGFTDTSWRGELLLKPQVMKALPGRAPSTLNLSELSAELIGSTAIVRGVNTQTSAGKLIGSVRFVDVFVYRSGRWQAVSAQETPILGDRGR